MAELILNPLHEISARRRPEDMPRSSRVVPEWSAPGGVLAVDRALALLLAFAETDKAQSLTDLSTATGFYKSTTLRLLASLQSSGFITRVPEGTYVLGPAIAKLHQVFRHSFALERVVMPSLEALVAETRESAAFYVPRGDQRLCLFRIDSPQPLRDHVEVGDLLPIDRGSPGQVISAFLGKEGAPYDTVRRRKVVALRGDRVADLAGISAPVFDQDADLLGVICLSMPTARLSDDLVPIYEQLVLREAGRATAAAGGDPALLASVADGV